ncbi:MAG TPA: glycosyltransferase [bacterium]|nr:glycosyltransferase [bacterium]
MNGLWLFMALLMSALFLFPYLGYPLLLRLKKRRYDLQPPPAPAAWPRVSAIVAAYNCAARIADKVRELRELDYPGEVQVVVIDDCSTDDTAAQAERAGADLVLRLKERRGKSEAQNVGAIEADGEVLLLTDATVTVKPDALRLLVAKLLEPGVGCVTGVDRSVAADERDVNKGAGLYTRFEIGLRNREAQTGTLLGVNGCLYALRADHRPPVPPECVDDLYVPLAVVDRGLRVTVEPEAAAIVRRAANQREEFRRKVRTFTGGLFTLAVARHDLPRATARLRWPLLGHKWLRWGGPFLALAALYFSLGFALRNPWGYVLFAPQALAWSLSLLGALLSALGRKVSSPLRLATFFGMVQLALLRAWFRYLTDRPIAAWEPTRREK